MFHVPICFFLVLDSIAIGIFLAVCVSNLHQVSCSEDAVQLVLDTLALENCDPLKMRMACLLNPYRSIDGTCNNLCNISRGSIQQPLRRFPGLNPPTQFEGENLPRRLAESGNELPNARKVSRTVFRSNTGNENGPPDQSHMVMTWGQFLDHDVTLTELIEGVDCGGNNEPCAEYIRVFWHRYSERKSATIQPRGAVYPTQEISSQPNWRAGETILR